MEEKSSGEGCIVFIAGRVCLLICTLLWTHCHPPRVLTTNQLCEEEEQAEDGEIVGGCPAELRGEPGRWGGY